jgi:hypothetical protein
VGGVLKRQSLVIWLFVVYIVLLGVAAWLGSPVLAGAFYILLSAQLVAHALWICPRCGNYGCAINPKSPYFFLGPKKTNKPPEVRAAINTLPFLIMLAATLVIALYAVFLASPAVLAIMALSLMILYYFYSQDACRGCPNKCPMTRN